jgi:hypothetical protein
MKTMEKKVIEKKVMNGGGMFGLALSWLRDRHRRSVFSLLLSLVELLPTPPAWNCQPCCGSLGLTVFLVIGGTVSGVELVGVGFISQLERFIIFFFL